MKARCAVILCCSFSIVACDKAKSLADKATTTVKEKIATAASPGKAATGKAGTEKVSTVVDAELQKLVDQSEEGTIFRKDLPFPTRLEVRSTRRIEMSGRFTLSSAFGKQAAATKGTQTNITKFELAGSQVRYTLEHSSFDLPMPENPEAAKKASSAEKKAAEGPLGKPTSAPPVTFRKTGKSWGADNRTDFRAAALAKELSPVFDQLLIDNALASRPQWFAKHRFKIGDELVVTGSALPMLLVGKAKGSFTIKLEAFEGVEGHPCGVFSITGDSSRKHFPDFEGGFIDEDVTIQSGKLWLSLLYPVILREELDTIQTCSSGSPGGAEVHGQGSFKVSVTRAWKRLD